MSEDLILSVVVLALFCILLPSFTLRVKLCEDDLIDLARKQKQPIILLRRRGTQFRATVYSQGKSFYAHSRLKVKDWPQDITVYEQDQRFSC